MSLKYHRSLIWLAVILIIILATMVSLASGTQWIGFKEIINIILGHSKDNTTAVIITKLRFPRIILSLLVGSGLAVAGTVYQGVIRNPMVDPYVVGISAGAGTGVTLAIFFQLNWTFMGFNTIPLMAFLGAILTVIIVYRLAVVDGSVPATTFLLAGVAVGFLLNSIMSFLMVIGENSIYKVIYWLMGSLAVANWENIKVILPYYLIGLLMILFYLKDLNIILLGEESATTLGVETEKAKNILLTGATMITAAAVSVSGVIGFIGLVIPHISRLLIGPDHRKLLPLSALLGGVFLMLSDTIARSLVPPLEIPVGIITALAGAPYFIYLLKRKNKV